MSEDVMSSAPLEDDQEQPKQWTIEQVRASTPAETVAAMDAGLLRDLGIGPTRRRR